VEAPNFILPDINGRAVSLRDQRGKVVLLYFTTTWCPYCRRDIPELKRLHGSMQGRPFEILAVYVSESAAKVRSFAKKNELPYPVLVDENASAARLYGVRGVPLRVVVDRNGKLGCYQCAYAEDTVEHLVRP
jgi:peroxiredoxin